MSIARVQSAVPFGTEIIPVTVECDSTRGIPGITVTGLASGAVAEARERIRGALRHIGCGGILERHYILNLLPSDVPKSTGNLDLPMALAIAAQAGVIENPKEVITGAMSMTGELYWGRADYGAANWALESGNDALCPRAKGDMLGHMAALHESGSVRAFDNLAEVIEWLQGGRVVDPVIPLPPGADPAEGDTLAAIIGLDFEKEALQLAAAGRHHVLLYGPPGSGKTMLAEALHGLLPPLGDVERREAARWQSLAPADDGEALEKLLRRVPPLQAPHHTTSAAALVGGGTMPRPGAATLAHHGILLLDELPEFPTKALEALRQPLEQKRVSIHRAAGRVTVPADFQCVATMNLCPCGRYGNGIAESDGAKAACRCAKAARQRYQNRVSEPLRDRFDIRLPVRPSVFLNEEIHAAPDALASRVRARERVIAARALHDARKREQPASLTLRGLQSMLTAEARRMIRSRQENGALSGRGAWRLLRVARTAADLARERNVDAAAVAFAWQCRGSLEGWE